MPSLNTNSLCSDGTNTFSLNGNTIVLPAAKLVLGAALTCNIAHTRIGLAVSGRVFVDNGAGNGGANNGVIDGAEAGLPGVAMQLTNCAGTVYATGASNGSGAYSLAFPSNFSGNVCVIQGPIAGNLATGANVAGMALQNGAAWLVGGTRYLWTRADRSIAFAVNANINYADINFGNIPVTTFALSTARTAPAGSAPVYAHTLNAGSTGSVNFSVSANDAVGPWNEALYLDTDCSGSQDPADPLIDGPLALVAGKPLCVLLKEFVPAGLPDGVSRVVVVKATVNYAGAAPPLTQVMTVTDATTVGDAQLQLDKKVRNVTRDGNFAASNSAATGDILEYRIVYTNVSAQPISRLTVADTTPPYTRFVSASAATLPAKLLSCTKKTPTSSTPVSCNTDDTEGSGGSVVWSFTGSLSPAQSGNVSFRVRVD